MSTVDCSEDSPQQYNVFDDDFRIFVQCKMSNTPAGASISASVRDWSDAAQLTFERTRPKFIDCPQFYEFRLTRHTAALAKKKYDSTCSYGRGVVCTRFSWSKTEGLHDQYFASFRDKTNNLRVHLRSIERKDDAEVTVGEKFWVELRTARAPDFDGAVAPTSPR